MMILIITDMFILSLSETVVTDIVLVKVSLACVNNEEVHGEMR